MLYCTSPERIHEAQVRRDEDLVRVLTVAAPACAAPEGHLPPPEQRELWTAPIHVAHREASPTILLSDDASLVVVLASNYTVTDAEQTAVEITHRDGGHVDLRAADVVGAPVVDPKPLVGDPKQRWLDRVECLDQRSGALVVVNARGEMRRIDLSAGKVEPVEMYDCPKANDARKANKTAKANETPKSSDTPPPRCGREQYRLRLPPESCPREPASRPAG
jgi:hypothetical protein